MRTHNKGTLLLALLAVGLAGSVSLASPAEVLGPVLAPLTAKGAYASADVVRLGDQQELYALNPTQLLMPASVVKLFTSAAALALYGPERRLVTEVLAPPKSRRNGTLAGPVFLKGGGDPFLDLTGLDALAVMLRLQGITKIEGAIVADASAFNGPAVGGDWDPADLEQPYAAPASALNLCGNVVSIVVTPTRPGRPPLVSLEPDAGHLSVTNQAVTSSRSHSPRLTRVGDADRFLLTGNVRRGAGFLVPLRDPAFFTAAVFKHRLQRKGIEVLGSVTLGSTPAEAEALASLNSPPLADIVSRTNKESLNYAAEVLLRLCGAPFDGKNTADAGLRVVHRFAALAGATPIALTDGCGLSRSSRVSARALTLLLDYAYRQPWAAAFYGSLPVAGQDGTLATRMREPPACGRVLAKTGTLTGVSALAGYVRGDDGPVLAFALLINNGPSAAQSKNVADAFAAALCPFAVAPTSPLPPSAARPQRYAALYAQQ